MSLRDNPGRVRAPAIGRRERKPQTSPVTALDRSKTRQIGTVVVALVVAIAGFAAAAFMLGRLELRSRSERSPSEAASPSAEPLPSVDPSVTARIPLGSDGGVSAIQYAKQSVWVKASFVEGGGIDQSMVFRVDASSNEVVAQIPIEGSAGFVSGGRRARLRLRSCMDCRIRPG